MIFEVLNSHFKRKKHEN